MHHNLAFYTVLLESFLTALHSGAHSTQPDARLLDQLGAVLADLLVGVFDSAELLAALRAEEAALGPGAVPPPAPAAAVAMPRPPLFADAARHPQRAYFVRLAALYSREKGAWPLLCAVWLTRCTLRRERGAAAGVRAYRRGAERGVARRPRAVRAAARGARCTAQRQAHRAGRGASPQPTRGQ